MCREIFCLHASRWFEAQKRPKQREILRRQVTQTKVYSARQTFQWHF